MQVCSDFNKHLVYCLKQLKVVTFSAGMLLSGDSYCEFIFFQSLVLEQRSKAVLFRFFSAKHVSLSKREKSKIINLNALLTFCCKTEVHKLRIVL